MLFQLKLGAMKMYNNLLFSSDLQCSVSALGFLLLDIEVTGPKYSFYSFVQDQVKEMEKSFEPDETEDEYFR